MSNWVDFTAIKLHVSLAVVLRHYQVPLRRSGRDQYRGLCPIHHGKGRDAFHANLGRNVFHCFSCGAGGSVLDFVAALEGCTLREAAVRLQQEGIAAQSTARPSAGKATVTEKIRTPAPLGFTLRGIDRTHPYLQARGILPSTAAEFGIGYYRRPGLLSGRLVIPIHNAHGELVAYCGRALDGSAPRYRFPPGFAKSQVLFNFHRAAAAGQRVAFVVEGFFDCFHLHQAGVRSVVALMGSALYEPQRHQLLERFPRVILMLDGDAAGRRATADIVTRLRPLCSVEVIDLAPEMQPDQMPREQIRQMLRACLDRLRADGIGPVQ
jgi:DNA primase